MNKEIKASYRGFTLIEVLVSISIFAIVMLVATGSVFSIVEANKKTHTLKSVMTNLNFALETMTREIRTGFRYSCDAGGDCPTTAGTTLRFKANRDIDGDASYSRLDANDQIEYTLVGGRVQKRILGAATSTYLITAPEISIESMKFYVIGTGTSDGRQPKVVLVIKGYAGTGTSRSTFTVETTLSQRVIDA